MALIKLPAENTTLTEFEAVRSFLATHGIDYEKWTPEHPVGADATPETILEAYGREIETLKGRGGYRTADVIDVRPTTPNLDAMLAKFSREHWHDEDEVRFIIEGRGIFHIHPPTRAVFAIEVEAGDLIRVPRGTHHWFDLCADRHIRAIRLFQDVSGWTPHYTDTGIDQQFQPVCFGPSYHVARGPHVNGAGASARIAAVLLDIEGTTTPIAFVVDQLFPYARKHLRQHLEGYATSPTYAALLDQLREAHAADQRAAEPVPPWLDTPPSARLDSAASYAEWLMDRDRKSTPLKSLQGTVWEEGYQRGELVGEVFADVPGALARWHAQGKPIGIFSSGSVLAQRLLFRHSSAGDLTRFLQWYFDTTTGKKADPDSYRRIAAAMNTPPHAIGFVSDLVAELDAACEAGLQTRLSIRPGNARLTPAQGHAVVRSLDELDQW